MHDSEILRTRLYPVVAAALDKNSRKFIDNIARYFNSKHEEIHEIAPYTRIYFNQNNVNDLFRSIGITEAEVKNIIKDCFFWDIGYVPLCAKEPYVEVLMCAIIYYLKNGDQKKAELTTIYTCFSGKFYTSLHSNFWKFPPKKQIMDYVVNNMLSDKFDLKKEGSVFNTVKKLSITWIETYTKRLTDKEITDDNIGKLIQQLRDRLKSMLLNIATLYYEAVDNKYYMNYEYDSLDEDDFHITSNDANLAARITEATIGIFTSQKINMKRCKDATAKNSSINYDELCSIMESIVAEKSNINKLRRVINILICDFMEAYPKVSVTSPNFIIHSMKPKPNTKNPLIIELKDTIIDWLMVHSEKYKFKTRIATKNDYYKAVLMYITLQINAVAIQQ